MMFENAYRQRLDADLARWQADGVIAPSVGDAIRAALPPAPKSINIPTVIGILGGLLIAAAFLAFVAANWTEIARPARFAILLVGIAGSYALGAWFDRSKRPYLADISATVGCIVFGASIALVGQMYHLAEDFAGGMMLWSAGSLIAAMLTGSRGALAVALAAGCFWSGMRFIEVSGTPHLPFIAFWLVGGALAVIWNSSVARHLVGVAALGWMFSLFIGVLENNTRSMLPIAGCTALLLGGGLALAHWSEDALGKLGLTLSIYGSFALAALLAPVGVGEFLSGARSEPTWGLVCGLAGTALAFVAAAAGRRSGAVFAGVSLLFAVAVAAGWTKGLSLPQPWAAYAFALASMLCLVVSGMLDNVRPRVVAGWLGLGLLIAGITWAVRGSLLRRAAFLAVSGIAAVIIATLLGRLVPKEEGR